ncbi:Cd2+/Zn2+-exporting ATPase [Arthrobacter stackebrandtii]|uniref:Cd2+/Zn2+-exporting ATPase n=1 Tax=Arthrobacter stackebrandtii TaxID=272161 RepID=A0ABS4YXB9_9MICC|nr:cation-translocating P-type ATPase [Arthrobacter stackebrandtii]MBP2413437.1 Cd2+/Zn2+-exporting ATPase [Arthrobacter stackebrandtii]PYH00714.1 heavy metal translocating P-type ATPase [Arthrobacter stackebrandtii]
MTGRTKARIAAATGIMLIAALAFHLFGLPEIRAGLLVVSAVTAGVPTAIRAFQALRHRAFSIDLLVSIAVVGALIIGEYVEAAVVSFLFVFGAWLEARTLEKTRRSLRELVDMAPQEAQVMRDGVAVTVGVDDVIEGDHVVIQSGGQIPVDGTITSGRALVNEATITGEPVPASKKVGDRVYGGTIVDNGFISMTAEQVGDDTTFAQIIELVEEAQESKTRAQRFLDRFAQIYTPSIVVLAVIVLIFSRNIEFALTFLVIACPGALVISTPVSMVAGLGNGARHGVLVKGGDALERFSKIDAMVFDKTGTLTVGRPEVTEVFPLGTHDAGTVLLLAARLELASEHPLGRTIVDEARERGLEVLTPPTDVEVIKGGGIRGQIDGHTVAVGSRRVLGEMGVELPAAAEAHAVERERLGNTAVFSVVDGQLAGVISIADKIRPEARDAIAAMRRRGIKKFYMLTGDNRHTAALVAAELGLDEFRAELLPADKVRIVQELKDAGHRVAMVGDGINDAPAIATADVGLAMGAGTDVSIQTADVILMGNRFDQLVHAYSLAKATVRNMVQNTWIALGTVVLLLAGVLAQKVFMATGMLVHEISVLVVIINAVRLVRYRDKRAPAPTADAGATPEAGPTADAVAVPGREAALDSRP